MKTIPVALGARSYDILFEHGALKKAGELFDLKRKVLIVTDSGVPVSYAEAVARQSKTPQVMIVPAGEESKSIPIFTSLHEKMLAHDFTRKDCVVAVGGGVVGDLAGFAAATYMRGIDFYNIPTTLLSQVDSSIGGKTAVNLDGVKNIVGAFYQPRRVLIDADTLETLPPRQISNGIAEALKMSVTCDAELFSLFEAGEITDHMDTVILRSLDIKRRIVEADERENDRRRILNFGHTLGHGIESAMRGALFHGECVALGMLPMCGERLRPRVARVLDKLHLPITCAFDREAALAAVLHDKKSEAESIAVVISNMPGKSEIVRKTPSELSALLDSIRA